MVNKFYYYQYCFPVYSRGEAPALCLPSEMTEGFMRMTVDSLELCSPKALNKTHDYYCHLYALLGRLIV